MPKAGRRYTLDARKKYEATPPAMGKQVLRTEAGKASRKEKKDTAEVQRDFQELFDNTSVT